MLQTTSLYIFVHLLQTNASSHAAWEIKSPSHSISSCGSMNIIVMLNFN